MTITKFGHSCFLVEEGGTRILIDPGDYSQGRVAELTNLDASLVSHVHGDHCDTDSLRSLRRLNPDVPLLTTAQARDQLSADGLTAEVFGDGESRQVGTVSVEGFGIDHIEIHSSLPRHQNVGFLIADRLFHAGDAYTLPTKPVEILALPVGGQWCKIGEAIDYALRVKPKLVFPIHDGMFSDPVRMAKWPTNILGKNEIEVRPLKIGVPTEI